MSCTRDEFKTQFLDRLGLFFGSNKLPPVKCELFWNKLNIFDVQTLSETANWVIENMNPTVVPSPEKLLQQATEISLRKRKVVRDEFSGPCSKGICNGTGLILTKYPGEIAERGARCPCEIGFQRWTGLPVYVGKSEKKYQTRNEHLGKVVNE